MTRLKAIDTAIGMWLPVEHWVTTPERRLPGEGPYSAQGWQRLRRADESSPWAVRAFIRKPKKTLAALDLLRVFDFSHLACVLEIGCGDMIQARIIKWAYPNLRYIASDFDSGAIESACAEPLLEGVEKRVLDAREPLPLDGVDLVIAWAVEYALDVSQVECLVRQTRAAQVPLLICSVSVSGPLGAVVHRLRRLAGRRTHGYARSLAWFERLARRLRSRVRVLSRSDSYWFLLFGAESA